MPQDRAGAREGQAGADLAKTLVGRSVCWALHAGCCMANMSDVLLLHIASLQNNPDAIQRCHAACSPAAVRVCCSMDGKIGRLPITLSVMPAGGSREGVFYAAGKAQLLSAVAAMASAQSIGLINTCWRVCCCAGEKLSQSLRIRWAKSQRQGL